MKGLAGPAGAMVVVALGLVPGGAIGKSLRQEPSEPRLSGGVDTAVSPSKDTLKGSLSRNLQVANDDALDVNGTPAERAANALAQRIELAETEFAASEGLFHVNNGDRSSAATFHKSLPHDSLGQVDSAAFEALTECIAQGDFDICELVPAGDVGRLSNPLAGITVEMAGAAGSALTLPPASALDSEDLAAQMAELHWMALTRDVPFSQYGEDEATVAAADNLATMPGFQNMVGVAVDRDGRADPQSQLFRTSAFGVETGPFISQLLVQDFTIDSITVAPIQKTFEPGADYMADYDEWLFIQNGGVPDHDDVLFDDVNRYIRNSRDLSRLVAADTVNTEAYRAALILLEQGAISGPGSNGPYAGSSRQAGFVNYGVSHLMRLVGTAELSQKSAWYQKWNVHMFVRPEAFGGTIHNVLLGKLNVDINPSLLKNTELLERVAERNGVINGRPGVLDRTYLLSQAVIEGSPTHPSYPAGHATQNGAFATVLKALVGLERGSDCFRDPKVPDDEGLTLLDFTGDCLTFEGEINKLAVNVAFGRNMCGVHWRIDSEQGLLLGEMAAVRILQQEAVTFPENAGYEFNLMSGETIRLETDGTFFINDRLCSGDAFMGADLC
uniref:Putative vanadium-dependent iodoperoxidase 3 n=1 Tax=Laminaria digitata TaxID=80365 RepID=B7ZGM6_9PHAE|nr:putative vanadium-dependent iodoperoxidase 3 [Laminaria digitata]